MLKPSDVSICMPYFNRMGRLLRTLESFKQHEYGKHNIEISICDDGSTKEPIPQELDTNGMPKKFSWLPKKERHMNPCVPINMSVLNSTAPIILLQSPESYHETPVAIQMKEKIKGYKDVILACVRITDHPKLQWYAHHVHRPVKYWFCQMMTRKLFDEVGGFSESYRDGSCYEDNDFVKKLENTGANWIWAEECIAVHNGRDKNKLLNVNRNKQIYESTHKDVT